ncbi:MAG: PQQ-binding-like beta-propeller repeat protein [Pirellulales bacterium]|nr:PQQ-binding-like beta-propeller repeat protein [Pirellulales bacterium]
MNNLPCFHVWSVILTGLLFLSSSGLLPAETWPRFRGPNGSGIGTARAMPTTWTDEDYLWRIELPGKGFSSPVVWDDRVYVTSGLEDDGTQVIRSIDTRSGQLVWEQRFPADAYKKHRLNSYATSTPTLDARGVYITWGGPKGSTVVALDRETGRQRWRYEMGPFVAMHNFGASPIVFEDLLIVLNDQDKHRMLIALDCATGELKWKSEENAETDATYATPCLFRPEGGACQLILGRTESGVTSLDPRSGSLNWRLDLFKFRSVGSPILSGDRIVAICGAGGGGQRAVAIRPGVPEKGVAPEVLYDVKKNLPYVPTPLIHDGLLFLWADSGKVKCVELATGEELWQERVKGKFYASPVLVAGRLYGLSDKGEMVVLAAGREYEMLGRIELGEKTMATPAVADGVMYLRTLSHLMALEGKPVSR